MPIFLLHICVVGIFYMLAILDMRILSEFISELIISKLINYLNIYIYILLNI